MITMGRLRSGGSGSGRSSTVKSASLLLPPSSIHFLSDSNTDILSRVLSSDLERNITDVTRRIVAATSSSGGHASPADCPKIQAVQKDGNWFTLNNSQLALCRRLEREGCCIQVKVDVVSLSDVPVQLRGMMTLPSVTTETDTSVTVTPDSSSNGNNSGVNAGASVTNVISAKAASVARLNNVMSVSGAESVAGSRMVIAAGQCQPLQHQRPEGSVAVCEKAGLFTNTACRQDCVSQFTNTNTTSSHKHHNTNHQQHSHQHHHKRSHNRSRASDICGRVASMTAGGGANDTGPSTTSTTNTIITTTMGETPAHTGSAMGAAGGSKRAVVPPPSGVVGDGTGIGELGTTPGGTVAVAKEKQVEGECQVSVLQGADQDVGRSTGKGYQKLDTAEPTEKSTKEKPASDKPKSELSETSDESDNSDDEESDSECEYVCHDDGLSLDWSQDGPDSSDGNSSDEDHSTDDERECLL